MSWPLVYDPEDNLGKCIVVLQESIESLKTYLSNEAVLMDLAESVDRAERQNKQDRTLVESSEYASNDYSQQRSRSNSVTSIATDVSFGI